MLDFVTGLLPTRHPARHAVRTCPVCQTVVADEERYVAVRGMRMHGGCAGYRNRRLGTSARVGRMAG